MRATILILFAASLGAAALPGTVPAGRVDPGRIDPGPMDGGIRMARARGHVEAEEWQAAVEVLEDHIRRTAGDADAHELIGECLLELERRDEAAHHLDTALAIHDAARDEKRARRARSLLTKADPLATRRRSFFKKIVTTLLKSSKRLHKDGHGERALDLLQRIEPLASGSDGQELAAFLAKVRAAFEEVDLDRAGEAQPESGIWPLFELETEHYDFECNLEPEVVQLVADTMEDIHSYYVLLYFDGDAKAVRGERATVRIFPDKQEMLSGWGGNGAPEGWWSPSERKVVCYDTRTRGENTSLDAMLETLFHEASHQFMTLLSRRGGWAPAWLNEGTSTFFEGAVAMADHRVLWPDAALGRLQNLAAMLERDTGPSPRQVIEYSDPGSYPGDHYAFGWGFVYFMQQYEDPESLEYVYRPLYAKYRTEITTRGGNSPELFDATFLGADSPLGHATFEHFESDWREWILESVKPLHFFPLEKRRELRMAHVKRYLDAAELVAGVRKAPVDEEELLVRALGHIEYVRTRIDKQEHADGELCLLQSDVLERLGRKASAASLIEEALELTESGRFELTPEAFEAQEARLYKLDSRNAGLRMARSQIRNLSRTARSLLADYEKRDEDLILRRYTFAAVTGGVLEDETTLLPAASELRAEAREAGRLLGQILELRTDEGAWKTVFSVPARNFAQEHDAVTIENVRPGGRINTELPIDGEYELRCRLLRGGRKPMGAMHGIVVSGRPEGDWSIVGIDHKGHLGLWETVISAGKGVTSKRVETIELDPPCAKDENPDVVIHVHPAGPDSERRMEIRIGEREVVETKVPRPLVGQVFAGLFVKDGRTTLEDAVVELYP